MKNQKLSILNIGPTPPRIGGSPFVNIETMNALASKGHRVRCISQLSSDDLGSPDYDLSWRDTGVEVYPVEAPFIPSSERLSDGEMGRRRSDIVERMEALVEIEKPDVVMVGHESYSAYANDVARAMGLPVVQVLHGTPTAMIDENDYPDDLRERFLSSVGKATLVVGVSNYLAKIMRRHGIKQSTYIHNGTDTSKFKPKDVKDEEFLASLGLSLSDKVVLHASTLRPVKRPLDIVESAPGVLDRDPSVKYLIVGDGPLRPEMEKRARELGVDEYFRFVGNVDYENMPSYFQNATMFLLPSQREGFGRVLREAQACGSVPIASDIGPAREVIENRKTGLLFGRGNLKSLVRKIVLLARSPDYRADISMRARDVAVRNNMGAMVGRYERALANPRGYLMENA